MNVSGEYSDYSKSEFLQLIEAILDNSYSDKSQDRFLLLFRKKIGHPKGANLIFHPSAGADDSPTGILSKVKRWSQENGLPGFKGEN